ncbi:unnamed protein product [Owenia fusiformis]|uniref:Uncharacterized protein n=1 Tax=Owenia fusiformis TaxID=6347 RepID=A0A8J1UYH1_OWEFU|nr:unnamed protein product [Owenia fusiformis]
MKAKKQVQSQSNLADIFVECNQKTIRQLSQAKLNRVSTEGILQGLIKPKTEIKPLIVDVRVKTESIFGDAIKDKQSGERTTRAKSKHVKKLARLVKKVTGGLHGNKTQTNKGTCNSAETCPKDGALEKQTTFTIEDPANTMPNNCRKRNHDKLIERDCVHPNKKYKIGKTTIQIEKTTIHITDSICIEEIKIPEELFTQKHITREVCSRSSKSLKSPPKKDILDLTMTDYNYESSNVVFHKNNDGKCEYFLTSSGTSRNSFRPSSSTSLRKNITGTTMVGGILHTDL